MLVHEKLGDDDLICTCGPQRYGRFYEMKRILNRLRWSKFSSASNNYFNRAEDSWGFAERLTSGSYDLVHLHWLGSNTLTVEEIGRLRQPVVWTLHDMWAFCGAEHYVSDDTEARFRHGYDPANRDPGESGPDMNRWVWTRKLRSWRRPMTIVCPSQWLANCARESVLFKDWPVVSIPNPIDVDLWQPIQKNAARARLGLANDKRIILFGSSTGESDPRKGADLLHEALHVLSSRGLKGIQLVVFGQETPRQKDPMPYPVTYLGHLKEDARIIDAYNSADVMLVPSRQDNLPQTAVEAHACGVPVVAFKVGGLPDIVSHLASGFLARPFEPNDLADGIEWVFEDESRREALGKTAREFAVQNFSESIIAKAYSDLYEQILQRTV
jgi:glycosyltransferase involved in cell wall biosynthesis